MIIAILHYADGHTLEREIPNIERFKTRHLDDLTGTSIVGHDFEYRVGQPEYLNTVHFDEVAVRRPQARAAKATQKA